MKGGGYGCRGVRCTAVYVIVDVSQIRPWTSQFSTDRDICLGNIGDLRKDVQDLPVSCIRCRFYSSHNYSKYHLSILSCFHYLNYLGSYHECE